jgi:hypothetical protein
MPRSLPSTVGSDRAKRNLATPELGQFLCGWGIECLRICCPNGTNVAPTSTRPIRGAVRTNLGGLANTPDQLSRASRGAYDARRVCCPESRN